MIIESPFRFFGWFLVSVRMVGGRPGPEPQPGLLPGQRLLDRPPLSRTPSWSCSSSSPLTRQMSFMITFKFCFSPTHPASGLTQLLTSDTSADPEHQHCVLRTSRTVSWLYWVEESSRMLTLPRTFKWQNVAFAEKAQYDDCMMYDALWPQNLRLKIWMVIPWQSRVWLQQQWNPQTGLCPLK